MHPISASEVMRLLAGHEVVLVGVEPPAPGSIVITPGFKVRHFSESSI